MRRGPVIGMVLASLLASVVFVRLHGRTHFATPPPEAGDERLLLSFDAEAVDGVDQLVLRDRNARIEHEQWKPIRGLSLKVHGASAIGEGRRVYVRSQLGRPAVRIVQQPRPENGNEIRVQIDDGSAPGAAPLRFELVAVPVRTAPHPINVLIVTIDSLRPDRLGSYGYERATSPNLDAFAQQSVRYSSAFSTSSFTPPSHASLLTSRYVGDHGLLTWNELPPEQITLPELLSTYDYRTGASVNLQLLSKQGLGQGVAWQREGARDGSVIVSDALGFIQAQEGHPWFLWIHLYDVHRPYKRPADLTRGWGHNDRPEVGDDRDDYNLEPDEVRARGFDEDDLRYIADRYDNGVAYADALLAPLFSELSTPERKANTLVVVTADHGESLLDHPDQLFTHDPFLHSVVTHVPLLIRYPEGHNAGQVSDELVSLIDVAPTVLSVLGVPAPAAFEGLSLAALGPGRTLPRKAIFHESWGWTEQKALRTREWLLVQDMKDRSTRSFDLETDPKELAPVLGSHVAAAGSLGEQLHGFSRRAERAEAPQLSPELVDQLRALGYAND